MARIVVTPLLVLLAACASSPEAVAPERPPEPIPPTLRFEFEPQSAAGDSASYSDEQRWGFSLHGILLEDYDADTSGPSQGISDADPSTIALQVDAFFPRWAYFAGVERREYDDVDSRELYAGARYLFLEGRMRPYVEGRLRYGLGLEPSGAGDSDPFPALGLGVGGIFRLTPRIHLDAKLAYEVARDIESDSSGGEVDLDGWVGTVGLGFTF